MKLTVQDRLEIEAILANMFALRDGGEAAGVADLFTEDATLRGGNIYHAKGREALMKHFLRPDMPRTIHFAGNRRFSIVDNHVEVVSYVLNLKQQSDGSVILTAQLVKDILVRDEGRWRIQAHNSDQLMSGQLTPLEVAAK